MRKFTKNQLTYYSITIVASILYLGLTFFAPAPKNTLGFSSFQILLIQITIIIPYVGSWFLGVYGLSTLERYITSETTENNTIIKLLTHVRTGLLWILSSAITVTLIGAVRSYFTADISTRPFFTIVTNYLYVFPTLIGFIFIYKGARFLQASKEMSEYRNTGYFLTTTIIILIASLYIFLIATNPTRQLSTNPLLPPTYFLPDILIILTIILPVLITWWLGFTAAFIMSDLIPYLTRAELFKGITRIVYGIWSIIFTSILIQALLSLGSTRLYGIGIGVILLLLYVFVILQGIGYFFIALGSNSLRKSVQT